MFKSIFTALAFMFARQGVASMHDDTLRERTHHKRREIRFRRSRRRAHPTPPNNNPPDLRIGFVDGDARKGESAFNAWPQ